MPKIYDNPKKNREPREETHKRTTLGNGPAGPSAQTDNRVNLALIAVALAIVLVLMLVKFARGEEGGQGIFNRPQDEAQTSASYYR